jgi:inhibitor of KinA sporulation pathway (predicted exonuclease)
MFLSNAPQDGVLHGLSPLLEPRNHFNLKVWFSNLNDKKKGFGLNKAVEYKDLKFIGQHHRALSDAENVAQILKTMV